MVAVVVAGMASGCGVAIPADPEGTFDRVSGGELRVGASPDGELVAVDVDRGAGGRVDGALADLVEGFADDIDAEVSWTIGREESLVGALEEGELDLVIGGMTDETPWTDRAAVTRGFPDLPGVEGDRSVVFLARLGENRFIGAVERFLDEETRGGEAAR